MLCAGFLIVPAAAKANGILYYYGTLRRVIVFAFLSAAVREPKRMLRINTIVIEKIRWFIKRKTFIRINICAKTKTKKNLKPTLSPTYNVYRYYLLFF